MVLETSGDHNGSTICWYLVGNIFHLSLKLMMPIKKNRSSVSDCANYGNCWMLLSGKVSAVVMLNRKPFCLCFFVVFPQPNEGKTLESGPLPDKQEMTKSRNSEFGEIR